MTKKVKTFSNVFCLIFYFISCTFLFTSVLSANEALNFVQSKIDYFDSLRQEFEKESTPQKEKEIRKKARESALNIVDIAEIIRLALGKNYKKSSPKDIQKLEDLFHQIISEKITRAQIPKNKTKRKKLTAHSRIKILGSQSKDDTIFKKKAHIVKIKIKRKKTVYDIDIYLLEKSEKFYVYDIHIDEASLLLDFKNQFSKIIRTKGIKHLLKKMGKQVSSFSGNK